MEDITTRSELKTYFETGDRPTQSQFSELIDAYVHLNEFNFGLSVQPTSETYRDYYDFYIANEIESSSAGHRIIKSLQSDNPQEIDNYFHVLGREVFYKKLYVKLIGGIDIEEHKPKIIIKRYKQRKRYKSGYIRKSGFYQEKPKDATGWNRKSEYVVTNKEMVLDIEPIHYFKPNSKIYKKFSPSGSLNRPGSFKYSIHSKPFLPLKLEVEILINGIAYRSQPVDLKIILGSAGETDAINYLVY
ncbi:hypothetical protein ACLI1A_11685 [Flavobacterium sp. RHBU_3]|uniref:hypothetical protein n=1 Tax=Flavobacterium sp. RHBU_3 TaxID=3391184 RepID=UPI003984E633